MVCICGGSTRWPALPWVTKRTQTLDKRIPCNFLSCFSTTQVRAFCTIRIRLFHLHHNFDLYHCLDEDLILSPVSGPYVFLQVRVLALLNCPLYRTIWVLPQVIGNKWDTYLDLLQADYTEGYARIVCSRNGHNGFGPNCSTATL